MDVAVIVSTDVARVLGGLRVVNSMFAGACGPYSCPVCRLTGRLGPASPASVFVLVYDGGAGRRVACLAHPGCSGSAVVVVDDQPPASAPRALPTVTWLRPPGASPNVVIACTPTTRTLRVTATGETVDQLTTGLLGVGFILVTCPTAHLPRVEGVTARPAGALLGVHGPDGAPLFRIVVDFSQPWWHTAAATGRVGLVVATGPRADDPGREHRADLVAAITAGTVVGATVALRASA